MADPRDALALVAMSFATPLPWFMSLAWDDFVTWFDRALKLRSMPR